MSGLYRDAVFYANDAESSILRMLPLQGAVKTKLRRVQLNGLRI